VVALGILGMYLAIIFEGQNVAILATLPLAIGASTNFPLLILSMYWGGFTTRGAVIGGSAGLVMVVTLIILGPNVWVKVMGHEKAIFPYAYPTLFSMSVCFLFGWFFSITDKSAQAKNEREAFPAQLALSQLGENVSALKN
jgi:cation/acetate symporter